MNIYDQVKATFNGKDDIIFSRKKIIELVHTKYGTNKTSVIPSDYCYNRTNQGVKFNKHIFVMLTNSEYKYIGEKYSYNGLVYCKPKGKKSLFIFGEWQNGLFTPQYSKVLLDKASESSEKLVNKQSDTESNVKHQLKSLSQEQIKRLYEEYLQLLDLEINVFGCKPTETRHLIGRIGELKCALLTQGTLTTMINQHGFDVVSNSGEKISVKTTAQINSGFVSINQNTIQHVDKLMVIQYKDCDLKPLYFGCIKKAIAVSRIYENKFELDLTKAKKLESDSLNNYF